MYPACRMARSSKGISAGGASLISLSATLRRTKPPMDSPAFFAFLESTVSSSLVKQTSTLQFLFLKNTHPFRWGFRGIAPDKRNLYGQIRCLLRQCHQPHDSNYLDTSKVRNALCRELERNTYTGIQRNISQTQIVLFAPC